MSKTLVLFPAFAAVLLGALLAWHPPGQASAVIWASRVEPYAETVNPAGNLALTFSFRGMAATTTPHTVQLQFLDASGAAVFTAAHDPAQHGNRRPSTAWQGDISYTVPGIVVPAGVAPGTYRIALSLVDSATGQALPLLGRLSDPYTVPLSRTLHQVGLLNVTHKPIVDAPLVCNGVTDVSQGLRLALAGARAGTVLRLPAGTCVYSAVVPPAPDNCTDQSPLPLRLPHGARDITVVGRGMPSTTLKAMNFNTSAMFADGVEGLLVRDLTLSSESAGAQRQLCPVANGLSVFNSQTVEINRVLVSRSAAAGMLLFAVRDGRVSDSRVLDTLADGIQVTHGSQRVRVENNTVLRSGDDAVSSIGHVPYLNNTITISGNTSVGSQASGVSVEGTTNAEVRGNTIEDSRVAGLRIASVASFQTGALNGIVAVDNTLTGVRRDSSVDHAAVMIFADYGNISNVVVTRNRINSPQANDAVRIRGSLNSAGNAPAYWASGISVTQNTVTDPTARTVRRCVSNPLPGTTANLVVWGNTLNGAACPATD